MSSEVNFFANNFSLEPIHISPPPAFALIFPVLEYLQEKKSNDLHLFHRNLVLSLSGNHFWTTIMLIHLLLAKRVNREFYIFWVRKDPLKTKMVYAGNLYRAVYYLIKQWGLSLQNNQCTDAVDLSCIDDILNQLDQKIIKSTIYKKCTRLCSKLELFLSKLPRQPKLQDNTRTDLSRFFVYCDSSGH